MDAFLIVIVIYEVELKDSITLRSLTEIAGATTSFPKIFVYDNSSCSKYDNTYDNIISYYHHDSTNAGVGGAYNYACKLAQSKNKKWLILSDQDTHFSFNYFTALTDNIERFPAGKLFCATIRSNNVIVSPTYYFFHKPVSYKKAKAGRFASKWYTVINSALAIEVNKMEEIGGYDEQLPLDYSDHYFFYKYKKRNKFFVMMDCEIAHNLSSYTDETFDKVYNRYKKHCLSTSIYSRKVRSVLPVLWLLIRALKLTFRFSRIDFFRFLIFRR
jgi:GT2 family glycosyltransferase